MTSIVIWLCIFIHSYNFGYNMDNDDDVDEGHIYARKKKQFLKKQNYDWLNSRWLFYSSSDDHHKWTENKNGRIIKITIRFGLEDENCLFVHSFIHSIMFAWCECRMTEYANDQTMGIPFRLYWLDRWWSINMIMMNK